MKKIPNFTTFVNEKIEDREDFSEIMNAMMNLPTEEIKKFQRELKASVNESALNEAFSTEFFTKLKAKFRRWFTDQLFDFLINRKKSYYEKLIDKLNIFDLTNIDDVYKAFPAFKPRSLYLAGGMDAAKKGGKVGWRNEVEYELEINKPGKKKNVPEIEIYMGGSDDPGHESDVEVVGVKPSYCIDGPMLDLFIANPRKTLRLYDYPALLNPVRKEVDRNKIDFDTYLDALRNREAPQKDIDDAIAFFRETVAKRIAYEDELIINQTDAIFLGMNPVAGAGTYAELQLISFLEKPLFCVLTGGYGGNDGVPGFVGGFKLWNMPQLCKMARNNKEMLILIDTIWQAAQKFNQ